jgi:hypothetical protein
MRFRNKNQPISRLFLKQETQPKQNNMKTSSLSHVTTASAVAHCIANQPATPVVVHWQMQDFPVRVARALVKQMHSIVWIVATAERAEIAVRELTKEGITVNPVSAMAATELSDDESLTPMQRLRRSKKAAAAPKRFPPPGIGTVSVVPVQALRQYTHLSEIVRWESALAVFDHIGTVNTRWLTVDMDAADADDESKPARFTPTRAENAHPIPFFRDHKVPMVFLARDEFEGALLRADFEHRDFPAVMLATRFQVPTRLKVSVVGTDLVTAKYAVGAFLSVVACDSETQVVGEALIGATTPDGLSMRTTTPLKKALLKISHQQKKLADVGEEQTKLSLDELRSIRIRDHIRTAVLAFDPTSRKPELVIFCPGDMVLAVTSYLPAATTARLMNWNPHASVLEGSALSAFAKNVIEAAQSYPTKLNRANRLARIGAAIAAVDKDKLPKRLFRFAITLHSATKIGSRLDLVGRPENFAGQSAKQDRAIAVFNKVLDLAYPWSPYAPGNKPDNLKGRREVMRRYKEHWAKLAGRNRC